MILLISASQVTGMTGVSHWHPAEDEFLILGQKIQLKFNSKTSGELLYSLRKDYLFLD
jgi:hypothetical protein